MIDLRSPSSARSIAEFIDRTIEAVVHTTGARIAAFVDATAARRCNGRGIWTEPVPAIELPSVLQIGITSDFDAPWPERPPARYALVPLREMGAGMFGWLYVYGGSWDTFGLEQMALSLAPIAQVVRDYEDVHRIAMHDHLTGLPNETQYQATAERLVAARLSFSLVFIDLNDFKKLNDTLGHAEGDKALKIVAHALHEARGDDSDFVARLHGDEFIALLRASSPETFIGRVRAILDRYGLSLSAGWARADGLTLEEASERADKHMYEVKAEYKRRHGSSR